MVENNPIYWYVPPSPVLKMNKGPCGYMPAGMPPRMAMSGSQQGSPFGPISMTSFSTWVDNIATDPAAGEEARGSGDNRSLADDDDVGEPLASDERMPADLLASQLAHYADEDGHAPLADGLPDLANQIWTKG